MKTENNIIIFYDGDCNACSRFVSILLKNKNLNPFKLASIHSQTAVDLNLDQTIDSIIYKDKDQYFYFSKAIFKTLKHLQGPLKLLVVFQILPTKLLDYLYRSFAKRRKLFFKNEKCILISEENKSLFLP